MNGRQQGIVRFLVIAIVGLLAGACSRKAVSDHDETRPSANDRRNLRPGGAFLRGLREAKEEQEGEDEEAPEDEDIEVDCVAFLRATIATPANGSHPGGRLPHLSGSRISS